MEYKIGEFVDAIPRTKLFVFDCGENARLFIDELVNTMLLPSDIMLYECVVKNPTYSILPVASLSHDFKKFWKNPEDVISKRVAPKGTVLCDSLKLVKLIKI